MLKILIVEDTTEKLRNILQTLEEVNGIDIETIDHEVDCLSAKKKLKANFYDLLILDIAIPQRKQDPIDLEGGMKLLEEVLSRDMYKVPSHIIGLTAKAEILEKANSGFKANILSIIQYSESDIEWQQALLKGVQQRLLAKLAAVNTPQSYNFDIAIITAVDREYQAVRALSNEWKELVFPGDSSSYIETVFERDEKRFRVVASCATQMGMNACAVLSMKLIYNFRPRYIFMPGIAASVKKSDTHGFGDVIVVDECWDGGAGKITEDAHGNSVFLPTASHLRLNVDIAQKMVQIKNNSNLLRAIKDGWKPNDVPNTELAIHIGSVSSVAGVIENSAVISELKSKDRKLLGLEMEAYGLYYSAYNCGNPKPVAVALKSVSDFANLAKNDLYQNYAAYTSTKIMFEFIMEHIE